MKTMLTVSLPTFVFVTPWVLLFALGLLVVLMYRQLGFLLRLRDRGSVRDGLTLGQAAPVFGYRTVDGTRGPVARFQPGKKWILLMFADPACMGCGKALAAVENVVRKSVSHLEVVVATTAEQAAIDAVEAFKKTSLNVVKVASNVQEGLYQTHTVPLAYLVDPTGIIRNKTIPSDESAVRKMLANMEATASVDTDDPNDRPRY
jgi:peroxiredoxin